MCTLRTPYPVCLKAFFTAWSLRGHHKVTTIWFYEWLNFEPTRINDPSFGSKLEPFMKRSETRIWNARSMRDQKILVTYAAWLRSRFGFTTFRISFMNGSSFEPTLGSFWSRMLRGCVPDSVSNVSNLVS